MSLHSFFRTILCLCLAWVSACSDPSGPRGHILVPADSSSRDLMTVDGHLFYLLNGEWTPVGPFDAKILPGSEYTRIYVDCDTDDCTGEVDVNHSGYWHGTQQVLQLDFHSPERSYLRTDVTLAGSRCQGSWPCFWKYAPNRYPLPPLPRCGVNGEARTQHDAWWGVQVTFSANGVTATLGRFGAVQAFSSNYYNQPACEGPTGPQQGSAYEGDCYFCQEWLYYDHGTLVKTEWECTPISSSACAGLVT